MSGAKKVPSVQLEVHVLKVPLYVRPSMQDVQAVELRQSRQGETQGKQVDPARYVPDGHDATQVELERYGVAPPQLVHVVAEPAHVEHGDEHAEHEDEELL